MPPQTAWHKHDTKDLLKVSYTDTGTGRKSWSVIGLHQFVRSLCRLVLTLAVFVALIIAVPAAVIYMLALNSTQVKVLCGLGSAVAAGGVWLGSRVARWSRQQAKRWWQERGGKTPGSDAGRG